LHITRTWAALIAATALLFAASAPAQEYPERTVRLVVAYPAGGPADIAARIVAEQVSTRLPHGIIVDNRPGAGGVIGTEVVANAAPDGYTLLLSGNNIAIAQALAEAPRYDSVQSFTHIAQIAALPTGVFVSAASPHATFKDLVAYAKANPNKLTYASGGNGTPSHLAMEMLKRAAGIDVRHVPYKGTPPAVTDLLGGRVDMLVTSIAGPMEQVKAGRLKILAVSSPERLEQLPQVPTIAESVPGFSFETWLAISAPRNVPPAVVQKLAGEIERALKDPALIKRMNDAGLKASYLPPDKTTARMASEQKAFAQVVKDAQIRAE
jgi:tripartite-type tricarboxylate transporter receptor subunit TctC